VALAGGAPVTLAEAPWFRGGVWGEDGSIYFVPNISVGVSRIPAKGGTLQPVTTILKDAGEVQHRWPEMLPGGKVLLYAAGLGTEWDDALIVAQRLHSGERTVLVRGGTAPRYLPTGQLVYARAGGLYAVGLDPSSLQVTRPPVEVARNVYVSSLGWAAMAVSRSGLLVTMPGDSVASLSVLSWVDRTGRGEPLRVPAVHFTQVLLSPAGERAALCTGNVIWVLDLPRQSLTRLSLPGRAWSPTWARDGRRVYFSYERGTNPQVFSKAADDTGQPALAISADTAMEPVAFTGDGSRLLALRTPSVGWDALLFHDLRRPQSQSTVLFELPSLYASYVSSDLSPDDRFVAYQSEESGRPEIYLRPASGEDRKWQVSIDGGVNPDWSRAGDEIFFLSGSKLMAAPVRVSGAEPVLGEPRVLFENHRLITFDAARDGKRFLVAEDPNPGAQPRLDVVVHWFAEVERRVKEARTP
jgi:hypothetical protein